MEYDDAAWKSIVAELPILKFVSTAISLRDLRHVRGNAVRCRLRDVGQCCRCYGVHRHLLLILQLASFAATLERMVPAQSDARA